MICCCILDISANDEIHYVKFIVADSDSHSITGDKTNKDYNFLRCMAM